MTQQYKKFVPEGYRFFVYIAGPISTGSWDENMQQATKAFIQLVHGGLIPFVPHATSQLVKEYIPAEAMHGLKTDSYEFWLDYDFSYIRDVCHCIFRLPGSSWGGDREEEYANALGLPVFTSIEEVLDFAESLGYSIRREAALKFGKSFDSAVRSGDKKRLAALI